MEAGTAFETERGISSVQVSHGHALVVVTGIEEAALGARRLDAVRLLAEAEISIDFLKLSLDGFSLVVPQDKGTAVRDLLCDAGFDARVLTDRAILTVNAVNIRDEAGMVARIAQTVVQAGAAIESLGDMHSSVLLVVDSESAECAADGLKKLIMNGGGA